ncbi:MAG: hypothetical protein OWQ48_02420 [Desulfurococcus sp.]|nr:hypothetical protein [Desulfurococcus sp.]
MLEKLSSAGKWWKVIAANVVLLVLAVSEWNYYDVRYFVNYWFEDYFLKGRFFEIYSGPLRAKVAYPPLAIYFFVIPYYVAWSLSLNIYLTRLIVKLPLLAAFNGVYYILNKRYGGRAGDLWLLNAIGYIVVAEYQFDLIATLLLAVGFLYAAEKKYTLSAVAIALSALVKQVLAILVLFPIISQLKEEGYRSAFKSLSIVLATVLLISAPFILVDPWAFIEKTTFFHAVRYPQNYSLWALPLYMAWYDLNALPQWITWAWIIPFVAAVLAVTVAYYVNPPVNEDMLLGYFTIQLLLVIMLNKVGNINYYTWVSPFLAVFLARNIRRVSYRVLALYMLTPVLTGVITGMLVEFPATVIGGDILIVEDQAWISAEQRVILSYGVDSLLYKLVIYLRSSPHMRSLFELLYEGRSVTMIISTLLYNMFLAYMVVLTARSIRESSTRG